MFYVPDCRRLVDDISLIPDALISAPYNIYPNVLYFRLLYYYFVDLWPGAIWPCFGLFGQ